MKYICPGSIPGMVQSFILKYCIMSKFNFTPFSGDPLTHRINYYYMPGNISVSSPANYSTDADAIHAAETFREDAYRVEVEKYTETPTGRKLVTIYQN